MEPNMGFGSILPKESIPLYVLYSPGKDLIQNSQDGVNDHVFYLTVTSIAEYGGLKENLDNVEKTTHSFESIWVLG